MKLKIFIYSFVYCCLVTVVHGQVNDPNGSTTLPTATFSIICPSAYPGGTKVNAVVSHDVKIPVTDTSLIAHLGNDEDHMTTVYTDGLGRPIQTVQRAPAPLLKDIVQPVFYGANGRQPSQILPYASSDKEGNFKINAFAESYSYNSVKYPGEQTYYGATVYDDSSLYRSQKSMRPGANGVGTSKGVTSRVMLNKATEDVRSWNYNGTGIPSTSGVWGNSTLLISESFGEDGLKNRTYRDNEGNVILTKREITTTSLTYPHKGWLCTYYVYDEMNKLRHIITPKVIDTIQTQGWALSQQLMDDLCYTYDYDKKGQVIYKKLPGQEAVKVIYDNSNRPVLIQDGNLEASNQWLFSKYDGLGRIVMNGKFLNSGSLSYNDLASQVEGTLTPDAFAAFLTQALNENTFTSTSTIPDAEIYAINYYDDYKNGPAGYTFCLDAVRAVPANTTVPFTPSQSIEAMGMITGNLVRVMDGTTATSQWTSAAFYYDAYSRLIQTQGTNFKGGRDTSSMQYNFNGGLVGSITSINNSASTQMPQIVTVSNVGYDQAGKPNGLYQKVSDEPYSRQIYKNNFDDMGQVRQHILGANAELQDYTYRVWGELESINKSYCESKAGDHFFGEVVLYDNGYNVISPDGMPAGMQWRLKGSGNTKRSYGYLYDGAKRLSTASYVQNSGLGWSNTAEDYSVKNLKYDGNGNILYMDQWGTKTGIGTFKMDELSYKYMQGGMSNQLQAVTDNLGVSYGFGEFTEQAGSGATTDYNYDDNGNATSDNNRNISTITYNYQNKPVLITFATGGRSIKFTYDALGTLLSKEISETGYTNKIIDYVGNAQYINDTLNSVSHGEGRVRPVTVALTGGGTKINYEYDFFVKDHMGNVRSTITEAPDENWGIPVMGRDGVDSHTPIPFNSRDGVSGGFTTGKQIYTVTSEIASAPSEEATFDNVAETRDVKPASISSTDVKAARLNESDHMIGPSIMLRVMAGDTVSVNTAAYYTVASGEDYTSHTSAEELAAGLLTALTGDGGYRTLNEGAGNPQLVCNSITQNEFLSGIQDLKLHDNPDGTKPQAFLNYLMLDEQMHVVSAQSGYLQTIDAESWNTLTVPPMVMDQSGYMVVFLSNESQMDVSFDNLTVQHYKGKLQDESHYYPYGLAITNKAFTLAPTNNTLYASKELNHREFSDGTGLDWSNFGARQYDAQIGRWHSADPLGEAAWSMTPYHYCNDNPIVFSDPDGRYAAPKKARQDQTSDDAFMNSFSAGGSGGGYGPDNWSGSAWSGGYGSEHVSGHVAGGGFDSYGSSVTYDWYAGAYMQGTMEISPMQAAGYYGGRQQKYGGSLKGGGHYEYEGHFVKGESTGFSMADFNGGMTYMDEFVTTSRWVVDNVEQEEKKGSWYETGGKFNWYLGTTASAFENGSGISRVGSNFSLYTATQTGRVFYGNQYVSTFSIAKGAKFIGVVSFGLGVLMDINGMQEYKNDPTSPNAVSPAKAGLNTTIGLYGLYISSIPAALYFGVDAFYPGGWNGAAKDQEILYRENRQINPNYRAFPGALKQ